jgi:hypothetical protein
MVRIDQLRRALLVTLREHPDVPEAVTFADRTLDFTTDAIKLPVINVVANSKRDVGEMNSDQIGFVTDENGNRVGRTYVDLFEATFTVSVLTAEGSSFDTYEIRNAVKDALYQHDPEGPDRSLVDETGTTLDDVWDVRFLEESENDDTTTTPTLRRWEQQLIIAGSEQYEFTGEDPVEAVDQSVNATE